MILSSDINLLILPGLYMQNWPIFEKEDHSGQERIIKITLLNTLCLGSVLEIIPNTVHAQVS